MPSQTQWHDDDTCDCRWQNELRRHYLNAGIPMEYWTLSCEHWVSDDTDALVAAQDYLDTWAGYKREGVGIGFFSPTQGTGKTMLACLIAKELVKRGEGVQFIRFHEIVRLFDAPYDEREEKESHLRRVPILILDEIVAGWSEQSSGLFAERLEDLIRYRTSGRGVTIVTSNLTWDELDEKYPRTFSLLKPRQIPIDVKGKDFRRDGEWYEPDGEKRPIV